MEKIQREKRSLEDLNVIDDFLMKTEKVARNFVV